MHIMSALVAILMTSYFNPDSGLRATNWLKIVAYGPKFDLR